MDKQAVQTSIEILETAERPLVIFPEGHISRTNDRLTPLLEGTALIAAGRQETGQGIRRSWSTRLRRGTPFRSTSSVPPRECWMKSRCADLAPSRGIGLYERFKKVGTGLLALKELYYLGQTQDGTIDERIARLIDAILKPLEAEWAGGNGDGHAVAHVKRLRSAILPDMIKGDLAEAEKARRWQLLEDADLAEQLYHYPPGYITGNAPRPESSRRWSDSRRIFLARSRCMARSKPRSRSAMPLKSAPAGKPAVKRPAHGGDRRPVASHARTSLRGHSAMTFAPWPVIGDFASGSSWPESSRGTGRRRVLGKRAPKAGYEVPLTDGVHLLTARIHRGFATNVAAGNRLLIISSLVIDLLGAYLLCTAIFGPSIRPYLGLVMVFALRRILWPMLCPLPALREWSGTIQGCRRCWSPTERRTTCFSRAIRRSPSTAPPRWRAIGKLGAGARTADCRVRGVNRSGAPRPLYDGCFHGDHLHLWVYSLSGTFAPWLDATILHWAGLGP